ncbi:GTP 3',8-cyclase MoaA [Microbacterium kribbense]|uniref:GTP 3',8-cyclase n=1 Tax=Microbacterium kribbense TaxID=433645 RepID=A0ABP7GJS5_9MICO
MSTLFDEAAQPSLGPIRRTGARAAGAGVAATPGHATQDTRGRELRDMRISVTDRCNFRCVYCMPKEIFGRDYVFLPKDQLLSFEEIVRVVQAGIAHGVHKVRLTGGEPLLRKGIEDLVRMLAELRTTEGTKPDIALTTNGSALAHLAPALKEAGLDRVTVSLDSLDDEVFRSMNDIDFPVQRVLDGIHAAADAGLRIKVNTVVKRGMNEGDIVDIAGHFKGTGVIVRFIEFMDVGTTNGWEMRDVVPSAEVLEKIAAVYPLQAVPPQYAAETAKRWQYVDGTGEVGVISSVTQPFCGACTRGRISADGKLFTCLFADHGHDLRGMLRDGCTDAELEGMIGRLWSVRDDHYSEIRGAATAALRTSSRIEMSYIGG